MAILPDPGKFVSGELQGANAMKPQAAPQAVIANPQPAGAGMVAGAAAEASSGMSQFVDVMQKAGQQIQTRHETVDRASLYGKFQAEASGELRRLQVEGDLSDIKTSNEYGKFLSDRINSYVNEHSGGGDSRAMLAARLEEARTHYGAQAGEIGLVLGQKKVADALDGRLTTIVGQVGSNPALLQVGLSQWKEHLKDMSPALTPDQEANLDRAAQSQIVLTSLNGALARGDTNSVKQAFQVNPGLRDMLAPEQQRQLETKIITIDHEKEKVANAGLAKLAQFEQIVGRPASQTERLHIAGMPLSTRESLSDKVAETERVLGRKLTPTETEKLAGVAGSKDHVFGAGFEGLSREILARDAPAFGENLLSGDKEREFLMAVGNAQMPVQRPNPVTGMMELMPAPPLPAFVTQALEKRGVQLPSAAPKPGGVDILQEVNPQLFQGGKTIFDMGSLYTGPVPAIAQLAGRTPGIGGGAGEIDSTKNTIEIAFRRLVTALQQNPRFSEGERSSIERELQVTSNLWDNETSFMNRMVGIDRALEGYAKDAERALSGETSLTTKQHQLDTLMTINAFRSKLMPTRLEADTQVEDFMKKNKPGTPFVAKDENGNWARWSVPGAKK